MLYDWDVIPLEKEPLGKPILSQVSFSTSLYFITTSPDLSLYIPFKFVEPSGLTLVIAFSITEAFGILVTGNKG